MVRHTRPLLSVLLCLLVLSWGTSPCVLARALDLPADDASVDAETSCTECCCQTSEGESSAPDPGKCPVCKSGKSLRDLPPQHGELALDAPSQQPEFAAPVTNVPVPASIDAAPVWTDSSPPEGRALQACPVGIVLLLS